MECLFQISSMTQLFYLQQPFMHDPAPKPNTAMSYNQFLDQDIMPFQNPVCKQTYQSLPKIYGNKKVVKYKYKKIQPKFNKIDNCYIPKYSLTPDNLKGISRYLFPNHPSKANYHNFKMPSSPSLRASTQQNNVKYDLYREENTQSNLSIKKVKLKPIYREVKSFDLSDLETPHKVRASTENTEGKRQNTQLQRMLIENHRKTTSFSDESRLSHENNLKSLSQNGIFFQNKNTSDSPSKRLKKIEQIQQQNQQQNPQPIYKHKENKKDQKYTRSQSYSHHQFRQKSAISLSRYVFSEKNDLTMFRSLQKNKSSRLKTKRSSTNSVLSTGLFRIPQQTDYRKYILNYKPMGKHFDFLDLAKRPLFRVIKDEKGVYFGEVNEDLQKNGLGVSISSKEIFQGEFNNNLRAIGFQRNIDGTYIGGYKDGMRSGQGEFIWNNGEVFKGNWQNGMKNGYGVWRSPNGHYYEGQWSQNRQHGNGLFKHYTSTYKGQFSNFLKHGSGEEVFVNGDKYKGEYKQGKPDGRGRYQWHNGGVYEGQFKQGKREGYGVWVDSDGTKYQGQFVDDVKHGKGRQSYKTGQKFIGMFNNGSKVSGKLYNSKNQEQQIIIK